MKRLISLILTTALLLTALLSCAAAEDGFTETVCAEQNFSVRIPAGATAEFDKDNEGLTIYTGSAGYIPYVIVRRRPMDMKFNNPANYLNDTYREYMENKYGDDSLGMNAATTWTFGGKELLGAKYRFKVSDHTVIQLQLIDVRPDGDVEYTVKYLEGDEEATLAATDEAVRSYQETDITAQPVEDNLSEGKPAEDKLSEEKPAEDTLSEEKPAADPGSAAVPEILTPSVFVKDFNDSFGIVADRYVEVLTEEGAELVKKNYTLTQEDQQGVISYYGNPDWSIEAGFMFTEVPSSPSDTPALLMNFTIKSGTPDGAVLLAQTTLKLIIAYHFQNGISFDDLAAWFDAEPDPANVFPLGDYTLNVAATGDGLQYSILPPADRNPYLSGVNLD